MSKKIKLKPKLNKNANSEWEIVDDISMAQDGKKVTPINEVFTDDFDEPTLYLKPKRGVPYAIEIGDDFNDMLPKDVPDIPKSTWNYLRENSKPNREWQDVITEKYLFPYRPSELPKNSIFRRNRTAPIDDAIHTIGNTYGNVKLTTSTGYAGETLTDKDYAKLVARGQNLSGGISNDEAINTEKALFWKNVANNIGKNGQTFESLLKFKSGGSISQQGYRDDSRVKVGKSKIEGKGLLANKQFGLNDIIGLSHMDDQPVGDIGNYHNHSDKPNAKSIKIGNQRFLIPIRPLKKGEEITTDYRQQPELEQPENFGKSSKERVMEDGGQYLTVDGEYHKVYKNAEEDIMVNHPKEDKGKWDTINLTDKSDANTIAEGVASVKKWHKENPYAFGGNVMLEKYKGGGSVSDKKSTLSKLKKALSLRENLGNLNTEPGYNIPLNQILRTAIGLEGEDYSNESMNPLAREQDAFRMYLGLPSKTGAFEQTGSNKYRIRDYNKLYPDTLLSDEAVKNWGVPHENEVPDPVNPAFDLYPYDDFLMGKHYITKGKDKKGEYLKYYDKFDFDPTKHANQFIDKNFNPSVAKYLKKATPVLDKLESAIFNPFELEDKVYYDPKTKLRSDIVLQQNKQKVNPFGSTAIPPELKSGGSIPIMQNGVNADWEILEEAQDGKKITNKDYQKDPLLGINIPRVSKGVGKYSQDIIDYLPPTVYDVPLAAKVAINKISPIKIFNTPKVKEDAIENISNFEIDNINYSTSLKGDRDAQLLNQGFPQKYNTFKKYNDSTNTYKIKDYDRQKLLNMYFKKANVLKGNRKYPYDKYIDNTGNIKTFKENLSTILFGSPLEKEQEIYDKTKKLLLRDDINGTLYPNKNAFGIMQNFTAKDNPEANSPFISIYDQLDYDLKFSEHPFLAPIQRAVDGIFPQNRFQIRDTIYYDPKTLKYKPQLKTIKQIGGKVNTDWEIIENSDKMSEYKNGGKTPAWQRKEGKSPTGGLNAKGRASLKAEGHDIKPPQPQGGARKKSFCKRMSGMKKKNTSAKTANDPNSRINLSLKKWKC